MWGAFIPAMNCGVFCVPYTPLYKRSSQAFLPPRFSRCSGPLSGHQAPSPQPDRASHRCLLARYPAATVQSRASTAHERPHPDCTSVFIHQDTFRFRCKRSCKSNPLLFPAAQFHRISLLKSLKTNEFKGSFHFSLIAASFACSLNARSLTLPSPLKGTCCR